MPPPPPVHRPPALCSWAPGSSGRGALRETGRHARSKEGELGAHPGLARTGGVDRVSKVLFLKVRLLGVLDWVEPCVAGGQS